MYVLHIMFKRNIQAKYICPSTHNSFAGYNVKHVVLDTGCTTLLLPITCDADIEYLARCFGNMNMYKWQIEAVPDVSPLPTCTLTITHVDGNMFPVVLCSNTSISSAMQVPRLRFLVTRKDGTILLQQPITLTDAEILCEYLDSVRGIDDAMPNLPIPRRKGYAVVGQDLLQDKYMFQCGNLAMICNDQLSAPPVTEHAGLLKQCEDQIRAEFSKMEFDSIGDYTTTE